MEIWEGWHVLRAHRHLHYPPYTPVEVGVSLHASGELRLHGNGMHATHDILYAMEHTTGTLVCRVQLLGERLDEETQSCARTRVVLWMVDAQAALLTWMGACLVRACQRAAQAGASPHPLVWEAARHVEAYPHLPAREQLAGLLHDYPRRTPRFNGFTPILPEPTRPHSAEETAVEVLRVHMSDVITRVLLPRLDGAARFVAAAAIDGVCSGSV
jgi:hypothetical protein